MYLTYLGEYMPIRNWGKDIGGAQFILERIIRHIIIIKISTNAFLFLFFDMNIQHT